MISVDVYPRGCTRRLPKLLNIIRLTMAENANTHCFLSLVEAEHPTLWISEPLADPGSGMQTTISC